MRVTVRPAVPADLPRLQALLYEQRREFEQQDLRQSITYVAEYGGEIVGFCSARLVMQIEPLLLAPLFKKHAPRFAQAKATLGLIQAADSWVGSEANRSGVRWYFCAVVGKTMQDLALHFGMYRTYIKSKFFSRST